MEYHLQESTTGKDVTLGDYEDNNKGNDGGNGGGNGTHGGESPNKQNEDRRRGTVHSLSKVPYPTLHLPFLPLSPSILTIPCYVTLIAPCHSPPLPLPYPSLTSTPTHPPFPPGGTRGIYAPSPVPVQALALQAIAAKTTIPTNSNNNNKTDGKAGKAQHNHNNMWHRVIKHYNVKTRVKMIMGLDAKRR